MNKNFTRAQNIDDVRRAKDIIRNDELLTNLYVNDNTLETWINRKQLFISADAETFFMLRERQDFYQLYFMSIGVDDMSDKLTTLLAQSKFVISTDLVGDCFDVSDAFARAGFERYMTLTRMFRLKTVEPAAIPDDSWFATPDEADAVEEIIHENMDPLCEQIPDTEDIREAVENRRVLMARHGSEPAAILFFDRHGVTATLRFWAGRKKFRGLGCGKLVYDRYVALNADARRLILWVRDDNITVKKIYLSDGKKFDSLHDEVWLWKGVLT